MFAVDIAFVCFYHAERILHVVKFLVHLLGEGEGQTEMGEGRGIGREWGGKKEGWKMGDARKNSHKTQQIWHLGTALAVTAPYIIHFLETSFQ